MLTIELAQKLQKSGYKPLQGVTDYHLFSHVNSLGFLDGLIDECVKLSETNDFHLELNDDGSWGASVDCFKNSPYIDGKTPKEAVANLWLELNK